MIQRRDERQWQGLEEALVLLGHERTDQYRTALPRLLAHAHAFLQRAFVSVEGVVGTHLNTARWPESRRALRMSRTTASGAAGRCANRSRRAGVPARWANGVPHRAAPPPRSTAR